MRQLSTWQTTVSLDLALDWRVLAFTATPACLSAIVAAWRRCSDLRVLLPARHSRTRDEACGDRRFAVRGALVIAQIAVSLVLVVAAGLFLRTFASLNRLPLGFVPEPLIVADLNLQTSGTPRETRGARVERLRTPWQQCPA